MKRPILPDMVRAILQTLEGAGFEAYVVGGAVRDMVMGREATDWDVATAASADDVGRLFPHLTRFSLQHGTVTLVHEGRHYEVSSFRGPLPTLEDDLAHRDFTINAMAFHPDAGRIIDPFGGSRDIARRMVRAVGAPEDRFQEDPLRMLRGVRIRCELGFTLERKTRETMVRMSPLLARAAKERIRDEVMRILLSETPSQGLRDLAQTGLLKEILPELRKGRSRAANAVSRRLLERMDRAEPVPVLRLAALFLDAANPAEPGAEAGSEWERASTAPEVMRRLKFSEHMVSRVTHLISRHRDAAGYDASWTDGDVRRFVRAVGRDQVILLLRLCLADLESQGKATGLLFELEERVRSSLKTGFPCRVQDLEVDGQKVMEVLKIPEGQDVGRALEALLEEVLDHPEWNTEEKLVELLEKMSKD